MEIPESINELTVETQADQFAVALTQPQVSIADVIVLLKQRLDPQGYRAFEEGTAFYKKDATSEKNIIKNLLLLYIDTITKAIRASDIDDEGKAEMIKVYTSFINGVTQNLDTLYTLTRYLNKDKNIIDVQKILYIILGYVIDTTNRLNNIKN